MTRTEIWKQIRSTYEVITVACRLGDAERLIKMAEENPEIAESAGVDSGTVRWLKNVMVMQGASATMQSMYQTLTVETSPKNSAKPLLALCEKYPQVTSKLNISLGWLRTLAYQATR